MAVRKSGRNAPKAFSQRVKHTILSTKCHNCLDVILRTKSEESNHNFNRSFALSQNDT